VTGVQTCALPIPALYETADLTPAAALWVHRGHRCITRLGVRLNQPDASTGAMFALVGDTLRALDVSVRVASPLPFEYLTRLEHLGVHARHMHPTPVPLVHFPTSLRSLAVSGKFEIAFPRAMPALTTLTLTGCGLGGLPPGCVSNTPRLETLVMDHNNFTSLDFPDSASLTRVSLRQCGLLCAVPALANLAGLRDLDLSRNSLVDDPEDPDWVFGALRGLSLDSLDVSHNQLNCLDALPRVRVLNVACNWIRALETPTRAEHLIVSAVPSLEFLAGSTRLRCLELHDPCPAYASPRGSPPGGSPSRPPKSLPLQRIVLAGGSLEIMNDVLRVSAMFPSITVSCK